MRTLALFLVALLLTAMTFAGNTVNAPYPTQLDGVTLPFSTKFTPYDVPTDTKIRTLLVTITYYRAENGGSPTYNCLNPNPAGYGSFGELSMTFSLTSLDGTTVVATDNLYPSGGYSTNTASPKLKGLVVQTFVVATGLDGDNPINDQLFPATYAYYTPQNGFSTFLTQTTYNRLFVLSVTDANQNNQYTCLSQFQVTINCKSRAVLYRQPTPTLIANVVSASSYSFMSTALKTQQYFPLQSTITNVAVTLAWTKNGPTGTCTSFQSISGVGDRLLEDLSATVTYTPVLTGTPITVVLVQTGTWITLTNQTESDFFSTTFDSTSYVFYPTSMVAGTVRPYQSLSVYNGMSAWGTWTVTVSNTDNTNPACVFGVQVAVQTCSVNGSCLCGTESLSSGANQNSVVGITTPNII